MNESNESNKPKAAKERKREGDAGWNEGLDEQMEQAVDALKQTFTGAGTDQGKTGR